MACKYDLLVEQVNKMLLMLCQ